MNSDDYSGFRGDGGSGDDLPRRNTNRVIGPPPLPPRPVLSTGGNPGFYGGYGGGAYGSNLAYGGYAGLPYPGGPGGGRYGGYSPYQQESNLAFSSISMMLESSYNAIYSSFRAVLGVADQFSRLRTHFAQIFTTMAVVKFFRWLYRRVLVFLRLKPANYANSAELAWNTAEGLSQLDHLGKSSPPTPGWSGLAYMAVVLGGPFLIWKLLAKIAGQVENSRKWAKGEGEHFEAKVLYTFNGVEENELSIDAGSMIRIAPKELQPAMRGWLMGSTMDGENIGLVPMNYIEIVNRKNQAFEQSTAERDMEAAYANLK